MAKIRLLNSVGATVTIDGVERESVTVDAGTTVRWSVSKEGYVTQEGDYTVWEDTVLPVVLRREEYEITFVVSPADADFSAYVPGGTAKSQKVDEGVYTLAVKWNDIVEWTCEKDGYIKQSKIFTATKSETIYVTLEEEAEEYAIIFQISPNGSTLKVTVDGAESTYEVAQKETVVTAKEGDELWWEVSHEGYETQSGSHIVTGGATIKVTLNLITSSGGSIAVTPGYLSLQHAGSGTFAVVSDGEWSVGGIPSGVMLRTGDGKSAKYLSEGDVLSGDAEITISLSSDAQSGAITFTLTDGSGSATLIYEVLDEHYIRVGSPDGFGADGGEATVTVRSTSAWRLASKSDWLAVAPDSGDEGSTAVVVTAEALPDGTDSRSGTAHFSNDEGDSATMTATQEREAERSLRLTPSSEVSEGEAITMEVTGSGAVSAYIEDYAPASGESVTLTVADRQYVLYGKDSPVQISVVDGVTYTCSLKHEMGSLTGLAYPYLLRLVYGGVTYTLTVYSGKDVGGSDAQPSGDAEAYSGGEGDENVNG